MENGKNLKKSRSKRRKDTVSSGPVTNEASSENIFLFLRFTIYSQILLKLTSSQRCLCVCVCVCVCRREGWEELKDYRIKETTMIHFKRRFQTTDKRTM